MLKTDTSNLHQLDLGKVLITGGDGFLADHLDRLLVSHGVTPYRLFNRSTHLTRRRTDFDSLEQLVSMEPSFDTIFHLAAYIPYGKMEEADTRLVSGNIALTNSLSQAFTGAHLVYSSSVSVYGHPEGIIRLDSPFRNPSLYGLSKLAAEVIVRNHPSYSIIRFTSLVGPGMKSNSFVPLVLMDALGSRFVRLFGDGSRLQNYLDVRDAARLCLAAARAREKEIILGVAGRSYSNREMAECIASITGAAIDYSGIDQGESFVYDWVYPERLDYEPSIDILMTIRDMISFIEKAKGS